MKFVLPIVKENGQEFSTSQELVELLQEESSGSFVVGEHSNWHGGIHISDHTASWCAKEYPVRAICDGKIIAYRLLDESEIATFEDTPIKFSNCFCLIEHTFQYKQAASSTADPTDTATASTDTASAASDVDTTAVVEESASVEAPAPAGAGSTASPEESLNFVFYSLYMHLLPWKEHDHLQYKLNVARSVRIDKPSCAGGEDGTERWYPNHSAKNTLPPGQTIELIDPASLTVTEANDNVAFGRVRESSRTTYRFVRVRVTSRGVHGTAVPATRGKIVWIAANEMGNEGINESWFSSISSIPPRWMIQTVTGRTTAATQTYGEDGGISTPLAGNVTLSYDIANITKFNSYARVRATCADGDRIIHPEKNIEISEFTSIPTGLHTLDTPIPIEAGNPVGYLGQCNTVDQYGTVHTKKQVHIEIFSMEEPPDEFFKVFNPESQPSDEETDEPLGIIPQKSDASATNGTFLTQQTLQTFKEILEDSCPFDVPLAPDGVTQTIQEVRDWVHRFDKDTTVVEPRPANTRISHYVTISDKIRRHFKSNPRSHCLKHTSEWTNDAAATVTFWNDDIKPKLEELKIDINKTLELLPSQWESQRSTLEQSKKVIQNSITRFEYEKERVSKFTWTNSVGLGNVFWHIYPIAESKWEDIMDATKFIDELVRLLGLPATEVRDARLTALANSEVRKTNLREVIQEMNRYYKETNIVPYIGDLAYMFATMLQETPTFRPITEGDQSNFNESRQTYHHYMYGIDSVSTRRARMAVANGQQAGDWERYHGHGLVQVTWRNNYEKVYRHLEEQNIATHDQLFPLPHRRPDQSLMLVLKYSVHAMIWGMDVGVFSGKALKDYLSKTPVTFDEYKLARNIINGQDHATRIARNAVFFEKILKKASIAK